MEHSFESIFLSTQLRYIESNDVDGLMQNYHEDAVLILPQEIIYGREAIRNLILEKIDVLVDLNIDTINTYLEASGIIVVRSIMMSRRGKKQTGHIWLLRNGKLAYQIITAIHDVET